MNTLNQRIAELLDKLKLTKPIAYLLVVTVLSGTSAFLTDLPTLVPEMSPIVKYFLASSSTFLAGLFGSRTTRYINIKDAEKVIPE